MKRGSGASTWALAVTEPMNAVLLIAPALAQICRLVMPLQGLHADVDALGSSDVQHIA